jgi:hypothetical protein
LASAELAGWLGPKAKAAAAWEDTFRAYLRGLEQPPASQAVSG